ncbi:MAG: sodium:sulfate symporter, partial [Pseudomonadota bacterium]
MEEQKKKAAGYDKYINWKLFIIPLGLLILLLAVPTPQSMLDVGIEYEFGPKYVQEYFAKEIFGKKSTELTQWQIQMVRMMEVSLQKSSFGQKSFLQRNEKWCKENNIQSTKEHMDQVMAFAKDIPPDKFRNLMDKGFQLRNEDLTFDKLTEKEKQKALKAG